MNDIGENLFEIRKRLLFEIMHRYSQYSDLSILAESFGLDFIQRNSSDSILNNVYMIIEKMPISIKLLENSVREIFKLDIERINGTTIPNFKNIYNCFLNKYDDEMVFLIAILSENESFIKYIIEQKGSEIELTFVESFNKKDYEKNIKKIKHLESDCEKIKKKNSEFKNKISELKTENFKYKNSIEKLIKENQNLLLEKVKLNKELKEKEIKLNEVLISNEKLKTKINEINENSLKKESELLKERDTMCYLLEEEKKIVKEFKDDIFLKDLESLILNEMSKNYTILNKIQDLLTIESVKLHEEYLKENVVLNKISILERIKEHTLREEQYRQIIESLNDFIPLAKESTETLEEKENPSLTEKIEEKDFLWEGIASKELDSFFIKTKVKKFYISNTIARSIGLQEGDAVKIIQTVYMQKDKSAAQIRFRFEKEEKANNIELYYGFGIIDLSKKMIISEFGNYKISQSSLIKYNLEDGMPVSFKYFVEDDIPLEICYIEKIYEEEVNSKIKLNNRKEKNTFEIKIEKKKIFNGEKVYVVGGDINKDYYKTDLSELGLEVIWSSGVEQYNMIESNVIKSTFVLILRKYAKHSITEKVRKECKRMDKKYYYVDTISKTGVLRFVVEHKEELI